MKNTAIEWDIEKAHDTGTLVHLKFVAGCLRSMNRDDTL